MQNKVVQEKEIIILLLSFTIARAAGITCSSCAMHFLRMRVSVPGYA